MLRAGLKSPGPAGGFGRQASEARERVALHSMARSQLVEEKQERGRENHQKAIVEDGF